jgi:hypothetical protein
MGALMQIANTTVGINEEFIEAFGRPAIQAIGAIVAWSHVRAPRESAERWGEVGLDRCGFIRWMQADSDLLRLDGRFPGVKVGLFNNNSGGLKHIELSAGRFRLLLAHDADPRTVVPFSEYGNSLARSNQWLLFPDFNDRQPDSSQTIYAWLFHSKSDTKGEVPWCLDVRFPDGRGGYAVDHLRLNLMFPSLMDETWLLNASVDFSAAVTTKEEKIAEEAMPKLRRALETGTN